MLDENKDEKNSRCTCLVLETSFYFNLVNYVQSAGVSLPMPGVRRCPCFLHKGTTVSVRTFYRCQQRDQTHEDAQPVEAVDEPVDAPVDEPVDAVDEPVDAFFTSVAFAKELVEQVVRKRAKATGITDILKCFKRHYGEFMDLP